MSVFVRALLAVNITVLTCLYHVLVGVKLEQILYYYCYHYYYFILFLSGQESFFNRVRLRKTNPILPSLLNTHPDMRIPSTCTTTRCLQPKVVWIILQHNDPTSETHLEHGSKWETKLAQMFHNKKKSLPRYGTPPLYTCLERICSESQWVFLSS